MREAGSSAGRLCGAYRALRRLAREPGARVRLSSGGIWIQFGTGADGNALDDASE
jgi:hypothetical protein